MKKMYTMLLLVAIAVCGIMLTGCGSKVDISQFIEIKSEGASGYGTATAKIKSENLLKELVGDIDSKSTSDAMKALKVSAAIGTINIELDKKENLKNGDTVNVKVTIPESSEDTLDASFSNMEYTYNVSGLKEVKEVDAFGEDILEVTYDGASPKTSVSFNNKSQDPALSQIYYSAESTSDLKNGDSIQITASYDKDTLLDAGYVVKAETSAYTVAAPTTYVDKIASLSESFNDKLQRQALDTLNAYTSEQEVKKTSWKLVGNYVDSNKAVAGYGDTQNDIYYIYKGTITPKDKQYKAKSVYVPVHYTDVAVDENGDGGSYVPSDHASIPDDTEGYQIGGWFSTFKCFLKEETMFDKCITQYVDKYNYEVSGSLKDYK